MSSVNIKIVTGSWGVLRSYSLASSGSALALLHVLPRRPVGTFTVLYSQPQAPSGTQNRHTLTDLNRYQTLHFHSTPPVTLGIVGNLALRGPKARAI